MAEELRFFIRIGLFTVLIGAIYWFVSYEEAGTWLLAGVGAGVVFFVVLVAGRATSSRQGGRGPKHLLGFADSTPEAPLALGEDTFPLSSAWPAVISLAAGLVGVGLIYGPWLWIPGVSLGLAGAWGWVTETR